MNQRWNAVVLFFVAMLMVTPMKGQERIFANYFDVLTNSPEGTEVTGRIHLERNKDVLVNPIPRSYRFEITGQSDGLFRIETRYDLSDRIMGVLLVDKGGKVSGKKTSYRVSVALKDGDRVLNNFEIEIRAVDKTLWSLLFERYAPQTIAQPRAYGRTKFSDEEVAKKIAELERNNGRFEGVKCYTAHPKDYKAVSDSYDSYRLYGTIEYEWQAVANQIGGLGHAYATSKTYGPQGQESQRLRLRNALYNAIITYTDCVPVEGRDMLIDGKPIGALTGDGFSLLQSHKLIGEQIATHQWGMTDPLIVPSVFLMPDILKGMAANDSVSMKVQQSLIRYFQLYTSIIKGRRAIDNPAERWGEIQDTLYSSGAWADANLGHRSRTMLALPLVWADYNRPMTYVQYWYSDFYKDKPYKGFSFSPGWSPHGVVADASRWQTKNAVPAHKYIQSGFQPDGTISHHIANATDAAMVAYGFEWLTDCNTVFGYFKDTEFKAADKHYQFQLDYLLRVYPKLFYKSRMDFLVSGRSYLEDLSRFVSKTYLGAVKELHRAKSKDTQLEGSEELLKVCDALKQKTYEYSGTDAYWVNEFLVHRRGENEKPYYASLKLKSERTVGAEDFGKIRKSWNAGYGILQLKVRGDEYDHRVPSNMDWHALPGLTEEWRTDPLPAGGGAQASLPGLNKIAGVLSDGKSGMGMYHHLTKETYNSTTALKSYYFLEDKIMALGSHIARVREGQQKEVTTFIDQSRFGEELTLCLNGKTQTLQPGESVAISETLSKPCWLHIGEKGYVILPKKELKLFVQTGKEVNTTDRKIANKKPNFIIAVGHGVERSEGQDDNYAYVMLPNVTKEEMPERMKRLAKELVYTQSADSIHALCSVGEKRYQYAFFRPGAIAVGGVNVASDDVAMVMLKEDATQWTLAVGNPMPDGKKQTLTFRTSLPLTPGTYSYQVGGVYPRQGEQVTVTATKKGAEVVVQLPDARDEAHYQYQSELYAATPIVITIAKK